LLEGEPLKPDGSNYIDWYERLRISLKRSGAFFMIIEPLGPEPDDDTDEYEDDTFCDRQDYYNLIEIVILSSMETEMRDWFYTTESNSMIGDLKHHFPSHVRLMIYDRLDEFHALKMEKHTSVDLHPGMMHRIHRQLILEFDHEIPDPIANDAVLRLLPPSYRSFVKEFVMRDEMVTFHELVARVRSLKVDCVQGEIIDPTVYVIYNVVKGRYLVILYLKCYHDTTLKISKYKWQKNLEQNYGCSQDMSLQSLEFSEPNSKYTKINKKEKSNMNSVTKRQNIKMILFT
jgi:hypothetical protein